MLERANIIVLSNLLNMKIWEVLVAVTAVLWELKHPRRHRIRQTRKNNRVTPATRALDVASDVPCKQST